jgi:hypothetical protein
MSFLSLSLSLFSLFLYLPKASNFKFSPFLQNLFCKSFEGLLHSGGSMKADEQCSEVEEEKDDSQAKK